MFKEFMVGVGAVLVGFFLCALWFIPGAFIANALWSAIAVPVFSLPSLTFWQMYGFMWLIHLLIPINTNLKIKD